MDKTKILDLIEKENPNCKRNSCNAYAIALSKIVLKYNSTYNKSVDSLNFLKDYDNVIKVLPEKITTKKNYITAIIVAIRNTESFSDVVEKYRKLLFDISKDYEKTIGQHNKTDKQSANWVSWSELMKVHKTLYNSIKERDIHIKKQLSKKEFLLLQQYIIASLYLLHPPRRTEYANVKVITSKSFNKMSEEDKSKNNWLVVKSRNSKWFYFTNYKTNSKYGNVKIIVESKLNSVLNLWLKHNRPEDKDNWWLLYGKNGKRMSNNNIIKNIQKTFSATGKRISVNMLRHIYISENTLKNVDVKKMKKDSELMGHSVETQMDYKKE